MTAPAHLPPLLALGWESFWLLAAIAALLALEAFYSGSETGAYSINRLRLQVRADRGRRTAVLWRRMLRDTPGLICVTLIGTNLAVYLKASLTTTLFLRQGHGELASEFYATAVLTPIVFVFGEVVPKNLFSRLADRLCYAVAWPLQVSSWLFRYSGLVFLLKGIAGGLVRLTGAGRKDAAESFTRRRQMTSLLADAAAAGGLSRTQSELASRALALAEVKLDIAVIPMKNVAAVPIDATPKAVLEVIRTRPFSRLAVLEGAPARVAGILNVYDYLAAHAERPQVPPEIRGLMKDPFLLPSHLPINDALLALRQAGRSMAVVTDAKNAPLGIVTTKDLVEEFVGEIEQW
jgi:CBS domain containing-hemolysin-like protein